MAQSWVGSLYPRPGWGQVKLSFVIQKHAQWRWLVTGLGRTDLISVITTDSH